MELVKCKENPKYFISSTGRLLNTDTWEMVNTSLDNDGYERASIPVDGKVKNMQIHRMVANNFIDNPEDKPQVNHKNYIRHDNRVSNLEWVTQSENMKHASINPNNKPTRFIQSNKISEDDAIFILSKYNRGLKAREVADIVGCSNDIVYKLWQGKTWKHLPREGK